MFGPKNYRLTPTAAVARSSSHEHTDYFRDRCGLHFGGAIMAGDEVAPSQCLVGKSNSHQRNSAGHHRPGGSNLESVAGSRVDPSPERTLQ